MSIRAEIQNLYDRNLFLQAYARTAEFWQPGIDLRTFAVEDLILGGRLAARLGGARLSRALFRAAADRAPQHPEVRYFALHAQHHKGLYAVLQFYDQNPEPGTERADLNASWLAGQGVLWAMVYDFERARKCVARAHVFRSESAWVSSCEAEVLLLEDRWDDARQAAERAWALNPGAPYAARVLSRCLIRCDRQPEAAQRLADAADAGESAEVAHLACWHLCAWSEHLADDERAPVVSRARAMLQRLPTLTPLADREERSAQARSALDVADQAGDHAAMRRLAEQIRAPFFHRMLDNIRQNPQGRRHRLPFRRVLQKYETCLPSSIASVTSALGVAIDADAIAGELTHGGTPVWAASEWLEQHGWLVRHFRVTPQTAPALLQAGIPFVLLLEAESSEHAVAAVGRDEAAGTLLLHDPIALREVEILLSDFGEEESPLGPKGMVIVPPAQIQTVERLIPATDMAAITALHAHQRAMEREGLKAAAAIVNRLAGQFPDDPAAAYLQAQQLLEEGCRSEALTHFQQLVQKYPRCLRFRRGLIIACRAMGNLALLRSTLEGVVERGLLPGIQSGQDWRYPPATYVCEYADLLRLSAAGLPRALRLLQSVLRRHHGTAEAWHNLADANWRKRLSAETLLAYRLASCLNRTQEHYARAYADALRATNQEEAGLSWLAMRADRLGRGGRAVWPWLTWIETLEHYGFPDRALAVQAEAAAIHRHQPDFLGFAVPFLIRMGRWDEAESGLQLLQATGAPARHAEAAALFHNLRGDWQAAQKHAEAWAREEPLSLRPRRFQLSLVAHGAGPRAAADLAATWSAENPGHDEYEELLYQWLAEVPDRTACDSLLAQRVVRNREDAWAWRELAFRTLARYDAADAADQADIRPRIIELLSACDRTAPLDPATLRAHALWLEAQNNWSAATEAWEQTIDAEPESFYSYRRAWDCATSLPASDRHALYTRLEPMLLRSTGHLHVAREFLFLVAQRFGPAVAEEASARWRLQRPDDPEVIEAASDLLLEYGHGRSDAARACDLLQPAVARFPYHVDLLFSLNQACQILDHKAAAEQALREIIRRHPANQQARLQMARLLERRGDLSAALQECDTACAAAPMDPRIWHARAWLLVRAARLDEARTIVQDGLQRQPKAVWWIEAAIALFGACGASAEAVAAAREGVRHFPEGAYLWHLLATTLKQHPSFANPGEVESSLRQALRYNAALFDAADLLAILLTEQHRYDEAASVMAAILPRLPDPSPAAGRQAWILRARGRNAEARQALLATVEAAPWYAWGWGCLFDWWSEDQSWDEARARLVPLHPVMRNDLNYRRRRLLLLVQAQLPQAELDAEWDHLLNDFPEDVVLHLNRYDDLHRLKLLPEAATVLNRALAIEPDNLFAMARQTALLCSEKHFDRAIENLLRVWFAPNEESSWPAHHAWEAIERENLGARAWQAARAHLEQGHQPTPQALYLLATAALQREGTPASRAKVQSRWRHWFPGPGGKELQSMLALIDRLPWGSAVHRAMLLERLDECGYVHLITGYAQLHPARIESEIPTWSQVGHALTRTDKPAARKHLASWRTRTGVEMWVPSNYVVCVPRRGRRNLLDIVTTCRDALHGLPHDHTAKHLAHLWADMCIRLRDEEGFRQVWREYGAYFTGELAKGEWFAAEDRWLLQALPAFAPLLAAEDPAVLRKAMRRHHRWILGDFMIPAYGCAGDWWR